MTLTRLGWEAMIEMTRKEYVAARFAETRTRANELMDKAMSMSGYVPGMPFRRALSWNDGKELDSYSRFNLGLEYDRNQKGSE